MPKISVIIPLYNAEKYIGLTMQTLLAQTFNDFEVIVVDDCSTDRSLEIVKTFVDPRIKIIRNEKNLGLPGSVRTVGLAHAHGDYIYFMDDDDLIAPNGLEILFNAAENSQADVTSSVYYFVPIDSEFQTIEELQTEKRPYGKNTAVSSDLKTRIVEEYLHNKSPIPPWMSLYRHKFLRANDIKFRDTIGEDVIFLIEVLCKTDKIFKLEDAFFVHRKRTGALTAPTEEHFYQLPRRLRSILDSFNSLDDILSDALKDYGSEDHFLIDSLSKKIIEKGLIRPYMVPFYRMSPFKTWQVIRQEIDEPLMRKFVYAYFAECFNNVQNDEETLGLKLKMRELQSNANVAPKISVIMPMYNAEKYIDTALKTLVDQTFTDFEIILVDDCSTDRTLEIAKSFIDPRIRIIENKKNLGHPGSARNVGFEHARGEYVYFMDDDDILMPNCLETFLDAIGDNDVVFDSAWLEAVNGENLLLEELDCRVVRLDGGKTVSTDPKQRIWDEMVQHKMHYPPWLFLYRRTLLNDIRFPDCVAEDVFFLFDVLLATSHIVKIREPVYIWRQHESSALHTINRLEKNIEGVVRLSAYLEKKLAAFNDPVFTNNVTFKVVNATILDYLMKIFSEEPIHCIEKAEEALRPIFGGNTMFVLNLIKAYIFQGIKDYHKVPGYDENNKTN